MGCIRVDKITEYLCDPLQRCLKVQPARPPVLCTPQNPCYTAVPAWSAAARRAAVRCNARLTTTHVMLSGLRAPRCLPAPAATGCLSVAGALALGERRRAPRRTTTRTCARRRRCAWPSCTTSTPSWSRTAASWTRSRRAAPPRRRAQGGWRARDEAQRGRLGNKQCKTLYTLDARHWTEPFGICVGWLGEGKGTACSDSGSQGPPGLCVLLRLLVLALRHAGTLEARRAGPVGGRTPFAQHLELGAGLRAGPAGRQQPDGGRQRGGRAGGGARGRRRGRVPHHQHLALQAAARAQRVHRVGSGAAPRPPRGARRAPLHVSAPSGARCRAGRVEPPAPVGMSCTDEARGPALLLAALHAMKSCVVNMRRVCCPASQARQRRQACGLSGRALGATKRYGKYHCFSP